METRSSNFDEFVLYRALALKFSGSHNLGSLPDEALDTARFRNVCAKMHPDLVDRLDSVISLLGVSKRDFIEIALIDALDRSEKTLHDVDAFGPHYEEKA
jgi:hypothetical protein